MDVCITYTCKLGMLPTHLKFWVECLLRIAIVMHSILGALLTYSLFPDTPDFLDGIQRCNPVDITLLVLDNDIFMSWDTEFYNTSAGCSFLVSVWNCSQPDTRFNCIVPESNQHVRGLSLSWYGCLPNGRLNHNDTIIIYIKWNNSDCNENETECSTLFYIPELTDTG